MPTAIAFAPDGRLFVAEKRGVVKVFDDLADTTPTVFVDIRTQVHNFWDRGLLSLALHPDFPDTPYIYVAYTHDAPIGGTAPRWGVANTDSDSCPNPPGATKDGCVVSGRISRFRAQGNVAVGAEEVLTEGWCQQFPSHSVGDIAFGSDGALYVSGGEGSNFLSADYGQYGNPVNPCGDPPGGVGSILTPPTAMGGALRAQSPRRPNGAPAVFNGAVLRLDPETGTSLPDNPWVGSSTPNSDRIIAYGLRNPFRIASRPGTDEIWIADVGWSDGEEINRIPDTADAVVENFGWPCYEGNQPQAVYAGLGLNLCESLFMAGTATPPLYTYAQDEPVVENDECSSGTQSISGLAFYTGGIYPDEYDNALFFSDYSRECIWVMLPDENGVPDPSRRAPFAAGAAGPVDLEIGPGGDIFYADFNTGTVRRIEFFPDNLPPVAIVDATPMDGIIPLIVVFDGSRSSDPEGGELTFEWDLDGDGVFDDSFIRTPQHTYVWARTAMAALRVTDPEGSSSTTAVPISVGNTRPQVTIDSPASGATWQVGQIISLAGHATDVEDGALPTTALSWSVIIHHCPEDCHAHQLQAFPATAEASFEAPDHDYPSYLEVKLTAVDSLGLSATVARSLYPLTSVVHLESVPSGMTLTIGGESATTPFAKTLILGSQVEIGAPSPQTALGTVYRFVSWSDGGSRDHTVTASGEPTFTATFTEQTQYCPAGSDLTQQGTIIARVTSPSGGGNPDIEVIRDGDKPEVGDTDSSRQYDTYDGPGSATDDWIGYTFPSVKTFGRVEFQEGKHYRNGGWFTQLGVQVRQGSVWTSVTGLAIVPTYPNTNDDVGFETYSLAFNPVVADGIRIYGNPGGSADFISVAELQVFCADSSATLQASAATTDSIRSRPRERQRGRRARLQRIDPVSSIRSAARRR